MEKAETRPNHHQGAAGGNPPGVLSGSKAWDAGEGWQRPLVTFQGQDAMADAVSTKERGSDQSLLGCLEQPGSQGISGE